MYPPAARMDAPNTGSKSSSEAHCGAFAEDGGGEQDSGNEQSGERNQNAIDPDGCAQRPPEAQQRPVELRGLHIFVDEEQIFVIAEVAERDDERHPCAEGDREGNCADAAQRRARWWNQVRRLDRVELAEASPWSQNAANMAQPIAGSRKIAVVLVSIINVKSTPMAADVAIGMPQPRKAHSEIECSEHQRGEHRLKNSQTAEAVEKRAGHDQSQRQQGDPPGRARPQQRVTQKEIGEEERDGQAARGFDVTPVKKKRIHSRNGHTGTAGAGLKSPGTYQWPKRWARIAALPYQPSSVYLAQSMYQGVWLGKSAARFSA